MQKKRLTQRFPFLLPLRKWQRKKFFYINMRFDKNRYAKTYCTQALPYEVFTASSLMLNKKSGHAIEYQYNKIHNLKVAAKTMDHLIIRPGETFSFCRCARFADRDTPYKNGLVFSNGQIVSAYGGGLCQLSNLLFWMFLHTPLTIMERHGHAVEDFPPTTEDLPCGTDATISEGWLDLKVKNNTDSVFQLQISFDETYMYGQVLSDLTQPYIYKLFNKSICYFEMNNRICRRASVDRRQIEKQTNRVTVQHLYTTQCEIGYTLPPDTEIKTVQ